MSSSHPRPPGCRIRFAALTLLLAALAGLAACGSELSEPSPGTSTSPLGSVAEATTIPATRPVTPSTTTTTTAPPTPGVGSPLVPGPGTVYVLGDSVTLGAQATVPPALAGWSVTFDAVENRRIDQGTSIVRARGGAMGRVLVVHLCTNWGGGDYAGAAEQLLGSLTGVQRVVWVTCTPWLPAVEAADAAIHGLPARHPEVVVADWAAVSATPSYTYGDGLHLKPAGASALAEIIAAAVGPVPAPG